MQRPSRIFRAWMESHHPSIMDKPRLRGIASSAFLAGYLLGVASGKQQAVNAAVREVAKRKASRTSNRR